MTDHINRMDQAVLLQFTGSEHYYRHGLVSNIVFTDGAKYVADTAGAYWLLDEIALAQRFDEVVRKEEFQVWQLKVNPDLTATLTCEDGNEQVVFSKSLDFTDFPPEGITFWFQNKTIFLPTEY
jgi:hypothetical protein